MSTIFDYLKEVTYDSIYDRPFKELDVLALTELTYLPLDTLCLKEIQQESQCACLMRWN